MLKMFTYQVKISVDEFSVAKAISKTRLDENYSKITSYLIVNVSYKSSDIKYGIKKDTKDDDIIFNLERFK